jgi:hypothetical protein
MEYANASGNLASLGIPKYNFGYIEAVPEMRKVANYVI